MKHTALVLLLLLMILILLVLYSNTSKRLIAVVDVAQNAAGAMTLQTIRIEIAKRNASARCLSTAGYYAKSIETQKKTDSVTSVMQQPHSRKKKIAIWTAK